MKAGGGDGCAGGATGAGADGDWPGTTEPGDEVRGERVVVVIVEVEVLTTVETVVVVTTVGGW